MACSPVGSMSSMNRVLHPVITKVRVWFLVMPDFFRLSFNRLGCSFYREDHVHFLISIRGSNMIHFIYIIILIYFNSTIGYINNTQWLALQMAWFAQWIHIWVRFDPTIVTIKQSLIVSQILSCPVVLSYLVLLESINKLFLRCR